MINQITQTKQTISDKTKAANPEDTKAGETEKPCRKPKLNSQLQND